MGTAAVLATWGLLIRMNVDAEKLEPYSMRQVQAEDKKIET